MKDSRPSRHPLQEQTHESRDDQGALALILAQPLRSLNLSLGHSLGRSLGRALVVALIATLYTACTNPPPPPPPPPPPKVKNPLPELPSTSEEDEINPELDPSVLPPKTAPKTAS